MTEKELYDFWNTPDIELLKQHISRDWTEKCSLDNLDFLGISKISRYCDICNTKVGTDNTGHDGFGHVTRRMKVYEIGAGIGRLLKILNEWGYTVYGSDYATEMVKESFNYLPPQKVWNNITLCDGTGLIDEPDNRFDIVFEIITFQHIPDVKVIYKYINEAHRILRPDGIFTFQVLKQPLPPQDKISIYYDLDKLLACGKDAGFSTNKMRVNSAWQNLVFIKNPK